MGTAAVLRGVKIVPFLFRISILARIFFIYVARWWIVSRLWITLFLRRHLFSFEVVDISPRHRLLSLSLFGWWWCFHMPKAFTKIVFVILFRDFYRKRFDFYGHWFQSSTHALYTNIRNLYTAITYESFICCLQKRGKTLAFIITIIQLLNFL